MTLSTGLRMSWGARTVGSMMIIFALFLSLFGGAVSASTPTDTWIATTLKAGERVSTRALLSTSSRGTQSWSARGACSVSGAILRVKQSGSCALTVRIGGTPARTLSRTLPVRRAKEINVLAAASLTRAFEQIATDFSRRQRHVTVRLTFAGSSTLATQMKKGAPADVIALADTETMKSLSSAGVVRHVQTFARNRLAILVAKGNPLGITTLRELARSSITVVLCDSAQPCGRYADAMLKRTGVSVNVASREGSVAGLITRVQTGEADAGIGYVSDATTNTNISMVTIPSAINTIATYPIAVAADSSSGDPAVNRTFVSFVLSPSGQRHLITAGFTAP